MATYEEIYGKRVKDFDSDPTLESSYEGQVWYDKSSGVLKSVVSIEATNSAPNMTTKRSLYGGGVGTSTAGLVVGGLDDSTYLNAVEEWNGSGWAAGGTYPTSRYGSATAGTQTAAIAYCGRVPGSPGPSSPAETYNYDGSSWTSGNSFPAGSNSLQGIGAVNTAVVSTQEYNSTAMHHWNGTSWTSANARNTAKGGQAAFGTQTAAVLAGGFPSDSNITEVYDGTNWTSGNTMNTGRQQLGGSGTQTDGLAYGGDTPPSETAKTTIESWDGTSWSTSPATLATAKTRCGTGRNTASGTWIAGGIGPGGGGEAFNGTEEYQKSINTITAAAWSAGGAMNQGRSGLGACGSKTAGLAAQGETSTDVNNVEEYDGSSWANATAHPESKQSASLTGLQTAAISLGGYPLVTTSVAYDGTNWTSAPALTVANANWAAGGPSTACFGISGGEAPSPSSGKYHDQYDGSSWTSATNMSTTRVQCAALGSAQDAILATGGRANTPGAPSVRVSTTESWNGSSWTSGPSMLVARSGHLGFGTQTAGIVQAGSTNPGSTNLSSQGRYDGTSFATGATNAVNHGGGLGGTGGTTAPISANVSNCFICGGPSSATATEEFNDETSAIASSTLTTS
jgi:hypothetical protein